MTLKPDVGTAGGQKYPVLRSIQTFLGQMAEGGAQPAPAVIKELLQNADDAGATEVSVVLDEREPPLTFSRDYAQLLDPALLVCNNARFRLAADFDLPDKPDDFSAICDVASGTKRASGTAAGRFGIGFNSVYFLTDTPLIFSRREVHVFDLLHQILDADGWRFPLDDFPARFGSLVGAAKPVLEWCLPKVVLGASSFGDLASDPQGDYDKTVFRLPLRRSPEGSHALYADRFPDANDRLRVLSAMADEAARSILFLKKVCLISFAVLRESGLHNLATVEATPCPPDFAEFLRLVEEQNREERASQRISSTFDRKITQHYFTPTEQPLSETSWLFHVRHEARFDDEHLGQLRARLRLNQERAVPWAAIAVPLNLDACRLDRAAAANWRVFLPLLEEGPSACVFSGAFFVGPSRQRTEFRLQESDEGKRRTEWNKLLVQNVLIQLLQDVSADLPTLAPGLLDDHPKEYLSLFPAARDKNSDPINLAEFLEQCFSQSVWGLSLRDIWNETFELLIGDTGATTVLELIPEWLLVYRDCFRELSNEGRRFVRFALGDALTARINRGAGVTICRVPSKDVALEVLRNSKPPNEKDLKRLLQLVSDGEAPIESLEDVWAFARSAENELLRFHADTLYVLDSERRESIIDDLRKLQLPFEQTEWIRKDVGLAPLLADFLPAVENVVEPSAPTVLELFRRLPEANGHDRIAHDYEIRPVIDFLVSQPPARMTPDLRLGFLVRTAHGKLDRRQLGVILLKPKAPTVEDDALWEVWFRKLFAEIDSAFSQQLHRLLTAHPTSLEMLHASDCRVVHARAQEALEILHQARLSRQEVYESLERAINEAADRNPDLTSRVTSVLLGAAYNDWESLDATRRYTILTLPIHRRSDGRFVRLVTGRDGDVEGVSQAFRLQSQDDIEDAPVVLPTCELLQTINSTAKNFYRRRIGLKEHGRAAVLKEILLQIGNPGVASEVMLKYLVRYYEEKLHELESSGDDDDLKQARELRTLFATARIVPSIDGSWEAAAQCAEAWQVADHLTSQGWQRPRLDSLLTQLFAGERLASIDASTRKLVNRLVNLASHDPRRIPALAITSESVDLSLVDRVKLLMDNWRDLPEAGVDPSSALLQFHVPVLEGSTVLALAEFFDEKSELSTHVLGMLAPRAVDVSRFAREFKLTARKVALLLKAFHVPQRSSQDLDERLVERFPEVWLSLSLAERVAVLRHIGVHGFASRLAQDSARLDSILVATQPPAWHQPTRVVSPLWMATQPPYLPSDSQPALTKTAESVRLVWNEWCALRTFGDVLPLVLQGAANVTEGPARAAKAVYRWLKNALGSSTIEEANELLGNRPWVLAERGDNLEFRCPGDVLLCPGEQVLKARFWVPALALPEVALRAQKEIGFVEVPPSTKATLVLIAECLAERAAFDDVGALQVYALVEQILDQSDVLDDEWQKIATHLLVYRAFRREDRQVTTQQLFIGDGHYNKDLSHRLICLKADSTLPKGLIKVYRRLGVTDRPTVSQVLAALASIETTDTKVKASYAQLIGALQELADETDAPVDEAQFAAIRVLTCAGTYEPIASCYWDEDLGCTEHVADGASRLVETTDKPTQKLVEWLRERNSDALVPLRSAAILEPSEEPQPIELTAELSYLLLPWRQWFKEALREGSALKERLVELGVVPLLEPPEMVPVDRIRVRCALSDGEVIEQATGWEGPLALGDASGRLFVRVLLGGVAHRVKAGWIDRLDAAIAREVAILMGCAPVFEKLSVCVSGILARLERPSTVLKRLHDTNRGHFFYQYHDQVADPQFSELFEEYQSTVKPSKRATDLEDKMDGLLKERFVPARREQIRGYGYDEFSVFAELLQNSEDAYIQRAELGMELPENPDISYRYIGSGDGPRVLEVEHRGRPFNYWQHGSCQDPSFSKDVEGVLRSAGSFKPHSGSAAPLESELKTIGRFGLGFKSVFLLTDRPEIHSGLWHFAIEGGCLPVEVSPPEDLQEDVTRIRLPLRADVEEQRDPVQLRDLLPFLKMITRLKLCTASSTTYDLECESEVLNKTDQTIVEQVTVSGPDAGRDSTVRFLRCRSREHEGQLALLLAHDGTPARWDDAFQYDLFAALPLKAKLGCGFAASHRFEVQSGRTHLVDPKANAKRNTEVATLLESLVEGLVTCASPSNPLSELLRGFWFVWRWEKGDGECDGLRRELAKSLVGLAERKPIVPTLDPKNPIRLGAEPCFSFFELPDAFREAIVAAQVTIRAEGGILAALARTNVVAEGFASAYRRAREYAGDRESRTLVSVGWEKVAEAFRDEAWFAERPELLCCLAASINEDRSQKTAAWVALCRVLGNDGQGQAVHRLPAELVVADFAGMQYLPQRLLRCVSIAYDEAALELLMLAGLLQQPSSENIQEWVHAATLTANECIGILRYLAEDERFMEYRDLAILFRSPWFPDRGMRLSTIDAFKRGIIPEDVLVDAVFKAWLGLVEGGPEPRKPARPRLDPREGLEKLFDWWQTRGESWTKSYEERLYPTGRPPLLRDNLHPKGLNDRRQWITFFLLASFHRMGRTKIVQHRDFLFTCERRGWLDVFAESDPDAQRWINVLKDYLDDQTGKLDYYQWMNQFVAIFQISTWLQEYIDSFLNVDRFKRDFGLDEILVSRESASFSSGPDAPSLTRALGIGACFVMREMMRLGLLHQPLAHRYCYVPSHQVCEVMEAMDCPDLGSSTPANRSSAIHRFLVEHLGEERATFGRGFDLPLLALAESSDRRVTLFGRDFLLEYRATSTGDDGEWRTRWDGVKFKIR